MTKPKQPWRCQKCGCLGKTIPRHTPRSRLCRWCAIDLQQAGQAWCSQGPDGDGHAVKQNQFTMGSPYVCIACTKTNNARRRADPANHAKAIAASRAYNEAHKDAAAAQRRAYYAANRDVILNQKKAYYLANRETITAKARAYRQRGIKPTVLARMYERQRQKRSLYKLNEKVKRARRFVAMLRGETP